MRPSLDRPGISKADSGKLTVSVRKRPPADIRKVVIKHLNYNSQCIVMNKVIPIFFLLYVQQAIASWSAFAVVTPESQSRYDVKIESDVSDSGTCTIKFDAIQYPYEHAWLILTSRKLSKTEQELRYFIWEHTNAPPGLILKSKISPAIDRTKFMDHENINDGYYEITLTNRTDHHAYVYIDYPRPIDDGGYYYSIDLGAYCGR